MGLSPYAIPKQKEKKDPTRKPTFIALLVLKTSEIGEFNQINPIDLPIDTFIDPKQIDPKVNNTQFFRVFSNQNKVNEEKVTHEEMIDTEIVAPVEEIEEDFYEQYKKEFGMELAHRRQIQAGGVGIYNQ